MKRLVKVLLVAVVVIFSLMFINNYNDGRHEKENWVWTIENDEAVLDYTPHYGELIFESLEDTIQVIGALGEVAVHAASGVIEGL